QEETLKTAGSLPGNELPDSTMGHPGAPGDPGSPVQANVLLESIRETAEGKNGEPAGLNGGDRHSKNDERQPQEKVTGPQSAPIKAPVPVALKIKERYRKGRIVEWQLLNNDRLISQIIYKGHKPVAIKTFDAQGNLLNNSIKIYYPNGRPKTVATFRKGVQVVTEGFYEKGQLRYHLVKSKDGRTVKFREFDENGRLKNGDYKEFYPGGQVRGMGQFRKGLPDGSFVSFCEDGKIVGERQFKRGRLLNQNLEREPSCEDAFAYLDSGIRPLIVLIVQKK
ncbi:MAG: hypothetical protein U1D99_11285, partial [Candidatus Omnitrophota bacterium]|nr:hypothetical protein [Candidatus Omnitrophota bacterium]